MASINTSAGTAEKYSSAIPEPFTYIPADVRSIALPDGSITSSFLDMYGRPSRDTGLETERNNRVTATQRLHLLNSGDIRRKLEQGQRIQNFLRQYQARPREAIDALYLTILSRYPTTDERESIAAYAQSTQLGGREVALDLAWALINSTEFLHSH
jgi:hypothetical protein